MSPSKVLLIVPLLLLCLLPPLDGYRYRPSNWHYLSSLYGEGGLYDVRNYLGGDLSMGGNSCGNGQQECGSHLGRGNPKKIAYGIAQKAAQDAKAASDAQVGAAEAASYQVKYDLAAKAVQSAKAAEAALAGKQQILEQLRQELAEAEEAFNGLATTMPSMRQNTEALVQAAQEAKAQLKHLTKIVQGASHNLARILNVSQLAQRELCGKKIILRAARQRAENLNRQLIEATKDMEVTKVEAYKATCAAVEAKQKAQRSRRMSWMNEELFWRR